MNWIQDQRWNANADDTYTYRIMGTPDGKFQLTLEQRFGSGRLNHFIDIYADLGTAQNAAESDYASRVTQQQPA